MESAVGGFLIGLAAALALVSDGKIMGISGIVGPFVRSCVLGGVKTKLWQVLFMLGLILGGITNFVFNKNMAFPGALSFGPAQYAAAGLAVGAGTRLGGGCTSGHGVCGLARLSFRSLVAVPLFMLVAGVTVAVSRHVLKSGWSGTPRVLPLQWPPAWHFPLAAFLASMFGTLVVLLVRPARTVLAPLISGAIFGLGVGCSGMTDQNKVLNFLDVGGTWDPSLAFVMGCALMVTFPAYAWARRASSCPLAEGAKFEVPSKTQIESSLLLGSTLFGLGWGLGGICPGPVIAAVIPYATSGEGPGLLFSLFLALFCAGWLVADQLVTRANARAQTESLGQSLAVTH